MAINKTAALILKSRKQGETSKIVTMLSEQFGKLEIVAKGSRSIKSKYLGVLEPYSHVSIVFYRKESRDFHYINQVDMINPFSSIHAQLGKMALAAIPCEIIDKSETGGHKNPQLYDLLLETLTLLEETETGQKNIIRSFYLNFLRISGFEPEISHCSVCNELEADRNIYFALDNGTYSCHDCGIFTESSMQITGRTLEYLRWLNNVPLQHSYKATIPSAIGKELDMLLVAFLRFHVEGLLYLKSIEYLEKLLKDFKNNIE